MVVDIRMTLNTKDVKRMTSRMQRHAQNTGPANRKIGKIMERSIERQFRMSGRPRWKRKSSKSRSGKLLVRSGRLVRSWGPTIVTRRGVTLESRLPYGPAHQVGLPQRQAHVPAHNRTITTAFGRTIAPVTATITAHNRLMPRLPARPVGILDQDMRQVHKAYTDHVLS